MIVYTFDPLGGFVAGDTETGLTSYAYPTSTYATAAKRNPVKVAAEMAAEINGTQRDYGRCGVGVAETYDARNWATLRVRGAVPSTFRAGV